MMHRLVAPSVVVGVLLFACSRPASETTLTAYSTGATPAEAPAPMPLPEAAAAPALPGDDERIGWPPGGVMRGVFLLDGKEFHTTLERLVARGMNAVVLDGKAYSGHFTYASKVPLAVAANATRHAKIEDLGTLVRAAHAKGVRVVMRNTCFSDPLMARAQPALAVQTANHTAHAVGWLDPANERAHEYLRDIISEQLDAGVDEIQLDYVRYPVEDVKGADFKSTQGKKTRPEVIRDFVRSVHALTEPRRAKLSVDVFGIVAFAYPQDLRSLGQDIALLAPECDAISPMVYPSHFPTGYRGWDDPANHPELVDIGTRAAVELMKKTKGSRAVIRPWLQAFPWRVTDYGSKYVAAQVRHAENAGAVGWLLWSPGQEYSAAWGAIPKNPRQ